MIYLFHGSDVEKVRTKAFEWIAKAREKEPDLHYARLAREEMTDGALSEAALSGGLFVKRLLILLDDPFPLRRALAEEETETETDTSSALEDKLDLLVASDNAVVILAPRLSAARAKKIEAKAAKTYRFDAAAREEARGFNVALANALAAKDPARLWLEVVCALRAGDAPEMLHGLLHWKARSLIERGGGRVDPAAARALSLSLIGLAQEARRGGLDLSRSLERFALSI